MSFISGDGASYGLRLNTTRPLNPFLLRLAAGGLLATIIALAALRARSLSKSGAVAAVALGAVCAAAGWSWALLLIGFFLSGTILSRVGASQKARRVDSIVSKGGRRDAIQVAANGGVFGAAAVGAIATGDFRFAAVGIGALAAAAADTWSTEIGTLGAVPPRLITSGKPVPAGTSGGISVAGSAAALAGALAAAGGARLAEWSVPFAAIAAAGFAGALLDSVLGAMLQARRYCDECNKETERLRHDCGARTRHSGGIEWLDNDAVNFIATIAGGLLALVITIFAGAV